MKEFFENNVKRMEMLLDLLYIFLILTSIQQVSAVFTPLPISSASTLPHQKLPAAPWGEGTLWWSFSQLRWS